MILRLSDCLIPSHWLIATHDLLLSDLYSRAFVCVDRMTPAHVSQILFSYEVFRSEVKKIQFKTGSPKVSCLSSSTLSNSFCQFPDQMDHAQFIKRLLRRFDHTLPLAQPRHLLLVLVSLHTIDSSLHHYAKRVLDRLIETTQIESLSLDMVGDVLYAIGLWDTARSKRKTRAVNSLVTRTNGMTDAEITDLNPSTLGKVLYGLGRLRHRGAAAFVDRSRLWFDERFNGYAMQSKDLVRCSYGYAFTGIHDSNLAYLLKKQAIRRAGFFNKWDLSMLTEAFDEMGVYLGEEIERQLLIGDKRILERIYGHR